MTRSSSAAVASLGMDVPELQRARALWGANRFDESLQEFEKAVAQPLSTRAIGRWKNYEKHFGPALARLAPLAKAFGYE